MDEFITHFLLCNIVISIIIGIFLALIYCKTIGHVTLIFSTYLGISWQNKANRYTHS